MKAKKFVFKNFEDAMTIHTRLFEMLKNEHIITQADIFHMLYQNYDSCPRNYFTTGWTSLTYSKVCPDGRKWALLLPEPKDLLAEYENYKTRTSEEVINAIEAIIGEKEGQRSSIIKKSFMVHN